ncbi:MAG: hypothetical protein HY657_13120 [Acidobacteria bacterium]|nr:hypothetical protein [Acidobacteriota bacterium]
MRHGRELWLCEHDQHTAAIPAWMTDRVACAALSIGPGLVSVDVLIELASLVAATRQAQDRVTDLHQESEDSAHEVLDALAGLLLAAVLGDGHDDERDDAREDHR